ncbi:MAG: hypothetical protein MJZ89_00570 [Paludibacteraceae bacterium]|nr:hypothetical protein [Paludibacteraceae bacterium]
MKNKVYSIVNILLGMIISFLGIGCSTQKKLAKEGQKFQSNEKIGHEPKLLVKYGVPGATYRVSPIQENDTVIGIPQERIDSVSQIKLKYGVPPTAFRIESIEETDSLSTAKE